MKRRRSSLRLKKIETSDICFFVELINYFIDEPATSALDTSAEDPGLTGGTTEPIADSNGDKKNVETAEEKIDYVKACTSKGYTAEQCCDTCPDSYIGRWVDDVCSDIEECGEQQAQSAEAAAREGNERGPASEGVGVGN